MTAGAPTGTLGLVSDSGWMNREIFPAVIRHLVHHTSSSLANPSLLIMDNHDSHLAIEALKIAKENGVVILTLPPHTSNKTQPLDVSVYSAFKGYYDAAVQAWLLQHPGLPISIYEIASRVNIAIERSMTPSNIRSGFRRTGIYPFDKFIFRDDDFALSQVTDRELKNNTAGDEEIMNRVEMENTVSTSNRTDSQQENLEIDKATTSQNVLDKKEDKKLLSPQEFRGYPKAKERKLNRKPRERGRSFIPTDIPEKDAIEEKHNEKMRKQALKNSKQLKRKIMDNCDSSEKEEFIPDDSSDDADWFEEEPLLCLTKELDRPPKVDDYVHIGVYSELDLG
ncbi:hypothetical protein GEV33_008873 [Tenebrio molitor]|uniref:DDE-1 domain-containing protein n=1 Tax=Tenebrio molitor TaxID=7067 RepID=A0A8J6HHV7_TENMO|nr:hypothetical protein GEV33_008873 [Tenebrio molitor]